MKNLLLLAVILITMTTHAQITKVYFQASGLTCSMCSNAINKSLKSLDFVDKVTANFKDYSFEVSFKLPDNIDFERMRRKVEDAGFFVSAFFATISFNNLQISSGQSAKAGATTLVFVNSTTRLLNGETRVKLLDKGFVSSKEYKSNAIAPSLTGSGTYHVSL